MTWLTAVKVALDPSPRQARSLASNAGGARFTFNFLLGRVIENYRVNRDARDNGEDGPGYMNVTAYGLRKYWNTIKDDVAPWWGENSKEAYSYACSSVADGIRNWSRSRTGKRKGKRVGFPKFKKKHAGDPSFAYTTGIKQPLVDDPYHLHLPRIGLVHCMENVVKRVHDGRVIRINIRRHAGRWYATLTVERVDEPSRRIAKPDAVVGIDLGVNHLATFSDGTVISNPRYYKHGHRKLAHAQKRLSRRVKGSRRYGKAREQVARYHAHVANQRRDTLNKLTTGIIHEYGTIVIEDLNVQGMTRNHHLAGSILDAGFHEFRRMLEIVQTGRDVPPSMDQRSYPSSPSLPADPCRLSTVNDVTISSKTSSILSLHPTS